MHLHELIGYPLLVVACLELVLGLFLLRHNPHHSRINISVAVFSFFTAAFSMVTGLMYVAASFGRDVTLLARFNWIGWLMLPASIQFIYYMRDEDSRAARIAGFVLYPFWIAVLALSVSTDLIETGPYALIPYIDRSGPLAKPLRAVGIVQLLWITVELFRLRSRVSGLKRAQLNYFTIGLLVFAGGGTLISGILPLLGRTALEPGLGACFSLPWVALAAYAMTRYRLFDLREAVVRTASVLLISAVVISLQLLLFRLFAPLGAVPAITLSLLLIGLGFFGTRFNRLVTQWVRQTIGGQRYDYHTVLRDSIRASATMLDLDELLEFILASMRKGLGVGSGRFFLRKADGRFALRQGFDRDEDISPVVVLSADMVQWLERTRRTAVREELEAQGRDADRGFFISVLRDIDASAAVPLFFQDRLLGVLTLGRKTSGDPYTSLDVDLLEVLAGHIAVAIENAMLYEQMETKVRERTRELEEARTSAEAANRAKSDFLSNISHELRTPLNSIIGFSEVMRDGTSGPLTPDQQSYIQDIWESGKHLQRIINNLLDLSKIEAGMMELECDEFHLKELLAGSLSLFRERAQQQGLTLHAEVGDDVGLIVADRTRIKQVVLNLVGNAVKFTPAGGRVGVAASRRDGGVQVDVWDTGIGISADGCGRLFRPFLQLDNTLTRKYEGTGLGLHLSRKIVELHNGRIWVESAPGKGSRFSFTVPDRAPAGE